MPYIPKEHEKYDLLPTCRKYGGEVFSYPSELADIDDRVIVLEYGTDGYAPSCITPYGYSSYDEYYESLDEYIDFCRDIDLALSQELVSLKKTMKKMNIKENWSIVRFVADVETGAFGLTKDRCYYWPCSAEEPEYEGVIDDEEFTSYLYPCDPGSWVIEEDPTGMAKRALSGRANAVQKWMLDEESLVPVGAPYYRLVKATIDKWNPYSLLPDAPSDEFDQYSLKIARRISPEDSVVVIAETIASAMGEFLDDKDPRCYLDIAESLFNAISTKSR
ncbi:MAG: hypothetical protein FWG00_01565 [Coriobacteriia bacterium]|nr:hypothetical protein [Coriobacteriia bacterium]